MCVRACVCVRVHAHMYLLRIVSMDKIFCFINTFIAIIIKPSIAIPRAVPVPVHHVGDAAGGGSDP